MFVVTAATGKLGAHVVEGLLSKIPASEVAVVVRNPEKAAEFKRRGVEVRYGDYAKPETLASAFRTGDRVLLISSTTVGQRAPQHRSVITAAAKARVERIAYTSILHAETSGLLLAEEHKVTEHALRASGVPFVLLRNGWYIENYTDNLAGVIQKGAILGNADGGRIAAATRADYAAAAVAALTEDSHANRAYELAGDDAFTLTELAAEVGRQIGKPIAYRNLSFDEHKKTWIDLGLPEPFAGVLADADAGIARGELDDDSGTLRRILGRPTTRLSTAVAAALAGMREAKSE